jgi:hypothetical protein
MNPSIRRFFTQYWRSLILIILAIVALGWLNLYHLQTLRPTLNTNEGGIINQSQTITQISRNPVYAPYRLVEYLVQHYTTHTIFLDRLISVLFGLITLGFFYLILRKRYTYYVAVLVSALLGSSTWFLQSARTGTPDILFMGLVFLLYFGQLLHRARHVLFASFMAVIVCGLLVYIPGMIWFLVIGFLWQQKYLTKLLDTIPATFRLLIVLAGAVIITPLGWAVVRTPSLIETFLGVPMHVLKPTQYLHNALEVPVNIFFRGPANPWTWLGRLPILDIFVTVMFIFGLYCYWIQRKLEFNRLIVGCILLGSILIIAGGPVTLTLLIPFLYIVASAGIAELFSEWLTVFPKNPLARGVGVGLLGLAIFLSGYYQATRYFVAWPDSTKSNNAIQQSID